MMWLCHRVRAQASEVNQVRPDKSSVPHPKVEGMRSMMMMQRGVATILLHELERVKEEEEEHMAKIHPDSHPKPVP
jgi:hypothetical protein